MDVVVVHTNHGRVLMVAAKGSNLNMQNLFIFFVFTYICGQILSFTIDGTTGLGATELAAPLSKIATTATVHSTDLFLNIDHIMIGNEIICYSGKSDTSFTGLTRGCLGTSAARHGNQSRVYGEATGLINQMIGFNLLQTLSNDGLIVGGIKVAFQLPAAIARTFTKLVMWDFAYFEGPAVYVQYMFYGLSAGLVLSLGVIVIKRG